MSKVEKLVALLKQPTTKKGLVGVATLLGISLSPGNWEIILFIGGLVYSVYQIFHDEDRKNG